MQNDVISMKMNLWGFQRYPNIHPSRLLAATGADHTTVASPFRYDYDMVIRVLLHNG